MTKAEIADNIHKQTGIDLPVVTEILNSFMVSVKGSMIKGENVYLRGFGTFAIRKRNEKQGRDISKKRFVIIPEHNAPTFKPCKSFSSEVRKKVKVEK